jgi:hypothetical protein
MFVVSTEVALPWLPSLGIGQVLHFFPVFLGEKLPLTPIRHVRLTYRYYPLDTVVKLSLLSIFAGPT